MGRRFTTREASEYTGIKHRALIEWRYLPADRRKGPATYKLGGRWYYDQDACDQWLEGSRASTLRGGQVPDVSHGMAVAV